jgi:putative sterol carrier protein
MATIDEITERMRERFAASDFDAKIKFDFGADGLIHVDGSQRPPAVGNADAEADCTITIALADFLDLVKGDLNPTTAFMMGKLKVDGSMAIALKLAGILG